MISEQGGKVVLVYLREFRQQETFLAKPLWGQEGEVRMPLLMGLLNATTQGRNALHEMKSAAGRSFTTTQPYSENN